MTTGRRCGSLAGDWSLFLAPSAVFEHPSIWAFDGLREIKIPAILDGRASGKCCDGQNGKQEGGLHVIM